MKVQMAAPLLLITLLSSCATLDTHNAKVYKDSPVIFENDLGLAVREEDNTITPYTYDGTDPDEWYKYNFKTQGVDEREAKVLKWTAVGYALDPITTAVKLKQGCVEGNALGQNLSTGQMFIVKGFAFGLVYLANYQSTIYQSTLKHDTRKTAAFGAVNYGLSVKNLLTKC